ncbi:MAG: (E)-4-hydroxy-3-methylbut-2-enyl-diphosphate synthase [Bacteroidetes bacterium]|nr:(E)-4-hydroxy-3-methylbut-2-enyl-diphosphate synthase [Bacteroidota bacterium]
MELYAQSLTEYKRLPTLEVQVGDLKIGNFNPILIQTMTTTDTMDTAATVAESIRCINAGAQLVRITAPSKKEAENLLNIKNELRRRGYNTPLVADIHFTPNAAEIAARIVEKVRVNPGNYVDKKKFELIEYSDADYVEEIERIQNRFTPLIKICKEYGTAMRIGTNHGSLSDRIMSRYGDTAIGMVESAMEFLRIAEGENYRNIVLSMKSSNPIVMVEAYRLLIKTMQDELGHCYPLHLGVTEAGDGEDGRIKSAIGIGSLLEDGIGDTIRVSLTEDPELELPVCANIIKRYGAAPMAALPAIPAQMLKNLNITDRHIRNTFPVQNVGGKNVPVVIAGLSSLSKIAHADLKPMGYIYDAALDKWKIGDMAADFAYTGNTKVDFALPGTLKLITDVASWVNDGNRKCFPLLNVAQYMNDAVNRSPLLNFVNVDLYAPEVSEVDKKNLLKKLSHDYTSVICLQSANANAVQSIRRMCLEFIENDISNPVILFCNSEKMNLEESLIHFAIETGSLLIDGFGNGIWLNDGVTDKTVLNSIAFGILQASRARISKTEYISCPSCGRTLFDLQETTAKIRAVTNHLKGVKIAIMGCIVNGPGEMADADFGYVGSGPGKITLYKGKEVVKRNVPAEVAVQELIELLKENKAWVEPEVLV